MVALGNSPCSDGDHKEMIQILCVQSNKRCKDREQEAEARKGSSGGERSWRECPVERGGLKGSQAEGGQEGRVKD